MAELTGPMPALCTTTSPPGGDGLVVGLDRHPCEASTAPCETADANNL